jgi:hypothetical protein
MNEMKRNWREGLPQVGERGSPERLVVNNRQGRHADWEREQQN